MNTTQTRIQIILPLLIWCTGWITPIHAQSFWNNLNISVDFAAAHHDRRTPERKENPPSRFAISQGLEGIWSPWQFGISVRKPILNWNNISLEAGLGYAREFQNYSRLVNLCFFSSPCPGISRYSDNYKIHLVQVPILGSFRLLGQALKAELSFLPLFDIYKKVRSSSGTVIGEKATFDFYSLEVNPGLRYQGNRIGIGINYRIYQVKKIDWVIFPGSREKFEDYNPLKFWFSVGYRLGNAE